VSFDCSVSLIDVFPAAVGYAIFRGSNSQKNAFRQNPEYAQKKRMFVDMKLKTNRYLHRLLCVICYE